MAVGLSGNARRRLGAKCFSVSAVRGRGSLLGKDGVGRTCGRSARGKQTGQSKFSELGPPFSRLGAQAVVDSPLGLEISVVGVGFLQPEKGGRPGNREVKLLVTDRPDKAELLFSALE